MLLILLRGTGSYTVISQKLDVMSAFLRSLMAEDGNYLFVNYPIRVLITHTV